MSSSGGKRTRESGGLTKRRSISFFKKTLGVIGLLLFFIFLAKIIFKPNLSQYPDLASCFVTSVHKVHLCKTSPKYATIQGISNFLIHSVLISEDDSFYIHQGIDWTEFKKSFVQNLKLKRFARGGSTVTQQLVKNAYLSQNKSVLRKFKEILLAQQIEKKYAKAVILEKYLNLIELGENIYGVKHAAQFYFKKAPIQLNLLESVYLTTLLPNPKVYSKSFFAKKLPEWQSERIEVLLKRLLRRNRISDELYQTARTNIHKFPWEGLELIETQDTESDDLDFLDNIVEEGFEKLRQQKSEQDLNPTFKESSANKDFGDTQFQKEEFSGEPQSEEEVPDANPEVEDIMEKQDESSTEITDSLEPEKLQSQ